MRSGIGAICLVAIALYARTSLSDDPSAGVPEQPPEEVTVTGEVPGPGMWKVTRADDPQQHVLWILGNAQPLPKKMRWRSKQVEAAIIGSQEILLGMSVAANPDKKIGFFKGLSLLPSALAARKNPEEAKLEDVLSPEEYARWKRLKKRFLGQNTAVERWRPIFAANELREEALDDLRLRNGLVSDTVKKLGEDHKIKMTTASYRFDIKTGDIKAKLKQFSREPLADQECFARTLDLVEAIANTDDIHARASAWASGDLEALTKFEPLPNPIIACQTAVMSSQIAQEVVPSDIREQLKATWLANAERALTENRSTFALLPMTELTAPDGQLAALRAKGYLVEEPARD